MIDLLYEHFLLEQDAQDPNHWSIPGYQEARQYLGEYYEMVKAALGEPFLDELLSRVEAVGTLEALASYHQGFRLAGRFSLALFGG